MSDESRRIYGLAIHMAAALGITLDEAINLTADDVKERRLRLTGRFGHAQEPTRREK